MTKLKRAAALGFVGAMLVVGAAPVHATPAASDEKCILMPIYPQDVYACVCRTVNAITITTIGREFHCSVNS